MTIISNRHKAIVSTLSKGVATDWNDDHEINYIDEISEELLHIGLTVAHTFDTAQTNGGTSPIWTLVGSAGTEHAYVVLNTGGTTGKISSMRYMLGGSNGNTCSANDLPILTLAVDISTIHTAGTVVEFGFFANATVPFTALQTGAYFRIRDATLYAVCGNAGAETETVVGAYNQYDHYRIEFTSTLVKFYVSNVTSFAVSIATNRPTVALTPKVSVISANNVDSTIRTDCIGWSRLRYQ